MTSKILAASILAFLAGCSNSSSPTASGTVPGRVSTTGAARVHGDLIPARLVAINVAPPTEMALLGGSDALAPRKPYPIDQPAEPVVARDMRRIMSGSDPAAYVFALDAPAGARVIVHPVDPTLTLTSAHLVDVATGVQLDLARDLTPESVNSLHVPSTPSPSTQPPISAMEGPQPFDVLGPVARPQGWEAPLVTVRRLTFDRPTNPGLIRLVVSPDVQQKGVWMELQQPNSHITLSGVVDELNHGVGDTAVITATLMSDRSPISGATVDGTIEMPDHSTGPTLAFADAGNGTYVARVPLATVNAQYAGVWGVHLHATGASSGSQFERHVETAFGYYASHAQITALGQPIVKRGADGLIDEISVDTDIETLATDRFSVRGTLTYTASDGTEHALAAAQTGEVVNQGTGTITLHFDNASLALAKVDGPFHLRDVALVSQAGGVTQYRIGRALDIATPAINHAQIRFPTTIPLQAQDLIDNGDLEAP